MEAWMDIASEIAKGNQGKLLTNWQRLTLFCLFESCQCTATGAQLAENERSSSRDPRKVECRCASQGSADMRMRVVEQKVRFWVTLFFEFLRGLISQERHTAVANGKVADFIRRQVSK